MKKLAQTAKNIWKDESGQGAVEYILLLVLVVGVISLFREKFQNAINGAGDKLRDKIQNFNP